MWSPQGLRKARSGANSPPLRLLRRHGQLDRLVRRADREECDRVDEPPHLGRVVVAVGRQNRRLEYDDAPIDESTQYNTDDQFAE